MFSQLKIPIKWLLFIASLLLFSLSLLAGLELWSGLHKAMIHFFLVFSLFLMLRHILMLFFAWKRTRAIRDIQPLAHLPTLSIIIPAFNEQEVIIDSLKGLLAIDYPSYDIIMVDDGSTDETVARAKQLQKNYPQQSLLIIKQSNSGKASALNTGLKHATGELILCVDADSKIAPDALKWGVRHFADNSIAAVAGQIRVANQQHWLTKFQQLEYIISQNFVRRALSWYGIVSVIPGPTGLFRRDVILELGGYNEDKELFAEDADLTVRLLAEGWKIVSEDRMIAKTEAPEGIYPLLRQRYRWKRGIYQTLHANFKSLIFSPRKREPFIAFLLLLEGFAMEIISFAITVFILASFIRFGELKLLYMWFGLLFSLDILVLMTSIGKDWWKSIPLLLAQKLLYGHALQVWNALALFDEWRSTKMSWDKVDRVGALSS